MINEKEKEKLKDSVAALKAIAVCLSSAVDNEDRITGDQVFHLINVIVERQKQLLS